MLSIIHVNFLNFHPQVLLLLRDLIINFVIKTVEKVPCLQVIYNRTKPLSSLVFCCYNTAASHLSYKTFHVGTSYVDIVGNRYINIDINFNQRAS